VIDAGTVLARRPDVRFRRVDEEGVVFIQEQARVLGLNETGMKILERIDGVAAVGALLGDLAPGLGVTEEKLEGDLFPFLEDLVGRGALEVVGREPAP
jgi:hypothetical protein